ncbi:MAG: tetratricopeptide repeat protein [Cyanobacteria bacterium P01_H01_bin.121]
MAVTVYQNSKSQILHGQASALYAAGRFQAVIEKYDRILAADATDIHAWIHRGYALCELQDYEAALESFQRALQLEPNDALAWHGCGIAQARQADYAAAFTSFDRTFILNPDDLKALYNRGNALIRLNRHQQALENFNMLIQKQPENYRAWYNRALVLAALRRYHDALSSLDTTVSIKPNCHYAWTYRGLILNRLYRFRDAMASFDRSLRHRTPNPNALYGKASTYALQGNVPQAVQLLRKAIVVGSNLYRVIAQTDPSFSKLINRPEIQTLLQFPSGNGERQQDSLKYQECSALNHGPNSALEF